MSFVIPQALTRRHNAALSDREHHETTFDATRIHLRAERNLYCIGK